MHDNDVTEPRCIWKFPLVNPNGWVRMDVPGVFIPRAVGLDPRGEPSLWAEVNPAYASKPVAVLVIGTGLEIPKAPKANWQYVGTFKQGPYVWHVYWDFE